MDIAALGSEYMMTSTGHISGKITHHCTQLQFTTSASGGKWRRRWRRCRGGLVRRRWSAMYLVGTRLLFVGIIRCDNAERHGCLHTKSRAVASDSAGGDNEDSTPRHVPGNDPPPSHLRLQCEYYYILSISNRTPWSNLKPHRACISVLSINSSSRRPSSS